MYKDVESEASRPERPPFVKLHIFLTSGKTFTFHEVESVSENESTLQFLYRAKSDGMGKLATFPVANIAGWSVLEA